MLDIKKAGLENKAKESKIDHYLLNLKIEIVNYVKDKNIANRLNVACDNLEQAINNNKKEGQPDEIS